MVPKPQYLVNIFCIYIKISGLYFKFYIPYKRTLYEESSFHYSHYLLGLSKETGVGSGDLCEGPGVDKSK